MKKLWARFSNWFIYVIANSEPRYPYILEGEKFDRNNTETVLLYRTMGKRHIFESSAQNLCNDPKLISKFHPLDVRIICFIAGVEQILAQPKSERDDKLQQLKQEIFNEPQR